MIHAHEVSHISRPTNEISSYSAAVAGSAALAAGGALALSPRRSFSPEQLENSQTINGFQYCRLYTVAGIPIIDFIVAYILLYVANSLWFRLHQGTVLVAAIPLTIVFNLLTNSKVQMSSFLLILIIISLFLIFLLEIPSNTDLMNTITPDSSTKDGLA